MIERKRAGLTQEKLAERVGIHRSYISRMENNEPINLGIETLYALAREIGVSPLYILGETEDPLHGIDDDELALDSVSAWGKELLGLLDKLTPGDKTFLLELARKLNRGDTPRIIGKEED